MMKLGLSSFVWTSPFSDESLPLLGKARDMGFDAYEICIEDPATINAGKIASEAKKQGMDVLICGAFGPERDIGSEAADYRETGINYVKTCVDIAYEVGSPIVAGPMYSGSGNMKPRTAKEIADRRAYIATNLKLLADYAAERGVKLALEPLNRFETDLLNTVEQGLNLFGEIGKENVGFLLDTFHMNIEEKNIHEAIRRAGTKVFHFHACANDRGTPGEDHFDWREISAALKDINYSGYAVIESFCPEIKEIARSFSLWRRVASSPDALAEQGLAFLSKALR